VKLFNQDETKEKIIWKCNNMEKKFDQIIVDKVYLWIMLFLNFIFDTFNFLKINFQQNRIRIYECLQNKFYMQNVILSLLYDCIHNMNK